MSESPQPIGWHVKLLAAVFGFLLILAGFFSPAAQSPGRPWWLPVLVGCFFLMPLYSTPARRNEGSTLKSCATRFYNLERVVSGLAFAGALAVQVLYRLFHPESGPIHEHPFYGRLALAFTVLFILGAGAQFYVAYLQTKLESAA